MNYYGVVFLVRQGPLGGAGPIYLTRGVAENWFTKPGFWELSGLVAGDSAICGRLAALILRLRPAGLRFEEFRSPVTWGGLGLRFSNRSGLRPAAI